MITVSTGYSIRTENHFVHCYRSQSYHSNKIFQWIAERKSIDKMPKNSVNFKHIEIWISVFLKN